jgi:hypothetical protein
MKENNVRPFIDEAIFGDQSSHFCFFYFDCYIEVKPNVNSVVSFSLKSFFSIVFFFLISWQPVEGIGGDRWKPVGSGFVACAIRSESD